MVRTCRLREIGICGAISKTIESYADTAGIGSRQGWWLVAVSCKLKAGQTTS